MPVIRLETTINAPVNRVFYLSLSVELHVHSTRSTHERVISGITSGLLTLNDSVTWEAKHLGVTQQLTSKIMACNPPFSFTDEMTKGIFHHLNHRHDFSFENGCTVMTDYFDYASPLGPLGWLADQLYIRRYLENFLIIRNQTIKEFAETNRWMDLPGMREVGRV